MQKKHYFKSTPISQPIENQNNYSITYNIDQLSQNDKPFF